MNRRVTDAERYNLASDYNYGRDNANPELGYPVLQLDEYVMLVRAFGKCAMTYTRKHPTPEEEIDSILSSLG